MKKLFIKIKTGGTIIILSIFVSIFCFNFCIAEYNKANEDDTEISTTTVQELKLEFPERDRGVLQDELNQISNEQSKVLENLINYKKPYFWILIVALILIILILIRLFKKLSHMDREFENYRKKIDSKNEIKDADEILYSINETNEIKPISEEDGKIKEIKINQNPEIHEEGEIREEEIKNENNSDDDYIFEE